MFINFKRSFILYLLLNSFTGLLTVFFPFLVGQEHSSLQIVIDYSILLVNFLFFFLIGFLLKKQKDDIQDLISVSIISLIGLIISVLGLSIGHGVINDTQSIWIFFTFYHMYAAPVFSVTPLSHAILLVLVTACAPSILLWLGLRYKAKTQEQRNINQNGNITVKGNVTYLNGIHHVQRSIEKHAK